MSFIGKNIRKIRMAKKLSQADFAALFNLARPSVGAYEEGRAEPKIDTIIQIAQHFGLSIDLLLVKEITINELYHFDKHATGVFQNAGESGRLPEPPKKEKKAEGIPLVPASRLFEYRTGRENKDFIASLPVIQLPAEKNRLNRAFEVNSKEMHYLQGGIKSGDIINTVLVGREPGDLAIGKVYFAVDGGMFFIRRLRSANKVLDFVADNPDFPEIRIGLEEVEELWEVKGVYSQNLEKPGAIETKMYEFEKSLQELLLRVKKLEDKG